MGAGSSNAGGQDRVCGPTGAEYDADARTGFEPRWDNPHAAREMSLGVTSAELFTVERAGGTKAHVELAIADLAGGRARSSGGSSTALVTVAFERSNKSKYDAPFYTSFGAFARGARLRLSQGKPEGSVPLSDSPPLTRLNYEPDELGGLGSLWLLEVRRPLTAEAALHMSHAVRSAARALQPNAGGTVALPLLGFNDEAEVDLRAATQEFAATAYALAAALPDLHKVQLLVPSRALFEAVREQFQRERRALRPGLPMRPPVQRLEQWAATSGQDTSFEAITAQVRLVASTYRQHADKPIADTEAQLAAVLCAAGRRVAEAFAAQFSHVRGYDPSAPLPVRLRFLRYTDGLAEGATTAEPDDGPLEPTSKTPRSRMDKHSGVRGLLSQATYESLRTLERVGFKAEHPALGSTLTLLDASLALDAMLQAVSVLSSPAFEGSAREAEAKAKAKAGKRPRSARRSQSRTALDELVENAEL